MGFSTKYEVSELLGLPFSPPLGITPPIFKDEAWLTILQLLCACIVYLATPLAIIGTG